jgi:hypothetical protein
MLTPILDSGVSVEAGCIALLERMQTGRFKVFDHLGDWLEWAPLHLPLICSQLRAQTIALRNSIPIKRAPTICSAQPGVPTTPFAKFISVNTPGACRDIQGLGST